MILFEGMMEKCFYSSKGFQEVIKVSCVVRRIKSGGHLYHEDEH